MARPGCNGLAARMSETLDLKAIRAYAAATEVR
jgi:hypothetical protein